MKVSSLWDTIYAVIYFAEEGGLRIIFWAVTIFSSL